MHRSRVRRALALIALPLLVWACASPAPSTSPSPPPTSPPSSAPTATASAALDDVYATINRQVQTIRGLDELEPVVPRIVSSDELAKVLRASFERDYPPAKMAADEALYKGLGLMPADQKLGDDFTELLETQVAGLYDPTTKSLYVLSKEGGVGPTEKFFYSHEYDHALQDQHFDLGAYQKGFENDSDQLLARQALVEGDAYVTMTLWMRDNLTAAEVGEVMSGANDPETLAALQRIPQIIQNQITFSAIQGTLFVTLQQAQGGWDVVNTAFRDPPQSTEQILHPERWAAREPRVEVKLPDDLAASMGKGWTAVQDTWGEQQIQIWLGGQAGAAAAEGWGGDRLAILQGPGGAWAIAWHTVWDSGSDAEEFEAAATVALGKATGKGSVLPGEGGKTRWVVVGSSDAVLSKVAGVLGLAG